MKKIFYILAAAIVALGTVACENEGLDNINPNINVDGDTVSFVAGINRTDLEGVATVWDADDTIVVTWNGNNYEFKNAETGDKNTFKCTAEGLSAIVNAENIKAVYSNNKDGKVDSAAGVAGALLEYEGAFGEIAFEVKNAFLKFTVADPVTLTASEGLFGGDLTELTFEEAGVHYVAVNAGVEATLEYKVGESMGKNLKTTFEAKKIYNLGNLTKSIAGDSNGKYYTELATAFKLAESGATITLLEDIALEGLTEGALMKVDKNLTLNVGEHTLTATLPTATKNASIFTVTKGAEFTLVGAGNIVIENGGGIGNIGNHFISNEGGIVNLDMDGGIELNVVGTPYINCIVDNNSTVGAATLNVKKGTYKQNSGNIFRSFVNHKTELATINISGGSIIGTGEKAIYIWNQKMGKTTGILNITAGTFEKVQIDNDDATLNQVTFTAEGYTLQQNANGYFDVVEKTPVAGDDKGNFYTELADAFKLAESGATITLSSDITSTEQIVVPAGKEFVLDLGGCTIDGQIGSVEAPANTNLGIFYISAGAKLTVKNGNINATIHSDYDGVNWSYGWNSAIFFNQQGELIIESGNYTISSESDGMIVCVVDNMSNWSNLNTVTTIKGGTFTYEKANGVIIRNRSNNPSNYTGKAIVNIEGGTFNGNDSRIWYHQTSTTNNGYINISGGEFNSVRFTNSNSKFTSRETWGNYKITGGTFNINTVKQLDQLSEAVCNAVSYKGATVALSDNIDYANGEFKAIGGVEISLDGTGFPTKGYFHMFRGTFDGKSKTISNMTIVAADNFDSFGLFGGLSTGAVVKNVTLDNITINSTHYAGALAGWIGTADADCEISGITVKNSNITVDTEVVGEGYDNGDKAGGVVGYMVAGEIKDCVVTGTKINGYRDLGGIVGYGRNIEAANNKVDDTVVITVNNEPNYKEYAIQADYSVNNYVGDFDATCTLSSNSGDATIVWGDIPATLVNYVAQVGEDKYETIKDAIAAANAAGASEIVIIDNVDLAEDSLSGFAGTIKGGEDVVLDFSNFPAASTYAFPISGTTTFENITFKFPAGSSSYLSAGLVGEGEFTFENCAFEGCFTINGNAEWAFNKCEFTNNDYYASFVYAAKEVVFTECSFSGKDRAAKIYGDGGDLYVEYHNCEFTSTTTNKAAIAIDATNANIIVIVDGCSQTNMNGLYSLDGTKGVVNPVAKDNNGKLYSSFEAALEASSTIELLDNIDGEYTIEKACTIDTKGFAFNYTVANDFKATVENGVITVVAKVSRKIYVKNDLGYTNTYIYAYNSANTEFPFGVWPGAKLSTKETINGNEFFVYTVPAELDETTFNVIFNDNANSETASKQVTFDADKAYRLSVCGAIDVDPKNTATFGYRVYVWNKNNRSGNDAPTLYIWDITNGDAALNGAWPGTKVTNTVTYKHKGGNRTYNYFVIPTTAYGHNIGVIASKGGNNKTGDLKRTLNCDLYVGYWFNSSSSYGFWGNGTAPFINPFFD